MTPRWVTGIPASDRARHPRHDLERDTGIAERQRLLATPTEHEGVPGLETHDPLAPTRRADQQTLDRGLLDRFLAGSLADAEPLGLRRVVDQLETYQRVV